MQKGPKTPCQRHKCISSTPPGALWRGSRGPFRGPLNNFWAKVGKKSETKRSRVQNSFQNASHFLHRKCASGHRANHAFRAENLQPEEECRFVHAPGGPREGIPETVSGSAEQLLSKVGEEIRDETVACQEFLPKRITLSSSKVRKRAPREPCFSARKPAARGQSRFCTRPRAPPRGDPGDRFGVR